MSLKKPHALSAILALPHFNNDESTRQLVKWCHACGLVFPAAMQEYHAPDCSPPWGAQLERETPKPGGLDALGVVKELKSINALFLAVAWPYQMTGEELIDTALSDLQQLISRLDGQAVEEPRKEAPATVEPEGSAVKTKNKCTCECGCAKPSMPLVANTCRRCALDCLGMFKGL